MFSIIGQGVPHRPVITRLVEVPHKDQTCSTKLFQRVSDLVLCQIIKRSRCQIFYRRVHPVPAMMKVFSAAPVRIHPIRDMVEKQGRVYTDQLGYFRVVSVDSHAQRSFLS